MCWASLKPWPGVYRSRGGAAAPLLCGPKALNHALVLTTVARTERQNVIVAEELRGRVTWAVNPVDLEDRNSLAKLLFQGDCHEPVAALRAVQGPKYAEAVFRKLTAQSFEGKWGGRRASRGGQPAVSLDGSGRSAKKRYNLLGSQA